MPAEQSQRVEQLYHAARERAPAERAAFLEHACGGDDALRREVESLLAEDGGVQSFLEAPALEIAKKMSGDESRESMIGRQLGPYSVVSLLAKGGMGEVYRARDTKLGRDVAVKVLPAIFARDPERLARFQREARLLASLNHPHIAAIYGMEESGGLHSLIMELVPGETLADKGPVPLDSALNICRQIAGGLEEAHRKNITHRDIKPANIKVTPEGVVKILDFGLAKALAWEQSGVDLSELPTASAVATEEGRILGTPAYMSPEQVRGKDVDKQTDIWGFGCVLYELLTGKRAYHRETVTDTIAAVLEREPDWQALPSTTPAAVLDLLRRCLQKDKDRRLRDIGDARIEIEEVLAGSHAREPSVAVSSKKRERLAWAVAITLGAALALVSVFYFNRTAPPTLPEIRMEVNTPATADPLSFAISPDGRRLVFLASNEGKSQLWVRALDSVTAQPLAGTDGAIHPFWSPDSASVGFFADNKLKRIDIVGGVPQVLADMNGQVGAAARGGAWNREGIILFGASQSPLRKVPATGGEPVAVTQLEAGQRDHRFPQFLPDGRHFIYFVQAGPAQGIYSGSLDGTAPKRLTNADVAGTVSPSGFLLFLRQATLFAQVFDFKRQELSGNPFPVAEPVAFDAVTTHAAGFSATSGIVAYRTTPVAARQLTWLDRSGKSVGAIGTPDSAGLNDVELSPDGKRVAVTRTVEGNTDIWLIDVVRGLPTRFTFDAAVDSSPVWSPDGSHVVFSSNRKGPYFNLYWKLSSGAGADESLLESDRNKAPSDWSFDGRFLLFRRIGPPGWHSWVLPVSGDKKPFPFLNTFNERNGQFSPDSKWIAYESNESGRYEIYVQPFPGPGGKFQISNNGGAQPRWSKNGKEIFYVSLDSKMMAVPVNVTRDGQSMEAGTAAALFPVRIAGGPLLQGGIGNQPQYAVSSDGQRFLVNVAADEGAAPPITLILNWSPKR